MRKNFVRRFEKVKAGKYRLVESWTDDVYGNTENTLSFVNHTGSHKWTYTYYGYPETAKTLKEALEVLRQTYDF